MPIKAPAPLSDAHQIDDFECSAPALTKWLRERAHQNQASGASRCFVVADGQQRVVGYYALAAGSVSAGETPGRIRRNMPDPVPVIVLGRLAVHVAWQGRGIGQGLLKDAVLRSLQAREQIGARALLCHAIDADAKAFYLKNGFVESPIHGLAVMLPLNP